MVAWRQAQAYRQDARGRVLACGGMTLREVPACFDVSPSSVCKGGARLREHGDACPGLQCIHVPLRPAPVTDALCAVGRGDGCHAPRLRGLVTCQWVSCTAWPGSRRPRVSHQGQWRMVVTARVPISHAPGCKSRFGGRNGTCSGSKRDSIDYNSLGVQRDPGIWQNGTKWDFILFNGLGVIWRCCEPGLWDQNGTNWVRNGTTREFSGLQ